MTTDDDRTPKPKPLAPVLVMAERCHGPCGRQRPPAELVSLGTGGAKICWDCWAWHEKALQMLAGAMPPGCQNCLKSMETLRREANAVFPDGEPRMYVHPLEGIYAVLCWVCSDQVVRATNLYRDTQYGWDQKLK